MERNKTLRIDPETMDIPIDENGDMEYVYGDDTTAQCVRLTLLTWKGTFPLDETHGTVRARSRPEERGARAGRG